MSSTGRYGLDSGHIKSATAHATKKVKVLSPAKKPASEGRLAPASEVFNFSRSVRTREKGSIVLVVLPFPGTKRLQGSKALHIFGTTNVEGPSLGGLEPRSWNPDGIPANDDPKVQANECGLFAILNLLILGRDIPAEKRIVSLHHLRALHLPAAAAMLEAGGSAAYGTKHAARIQGGALKNFERAGLALALEAATYF